MLALKYKTHNNYGYDRANSTDDERRYYAAHHPTISAGFWKCFLNAARAKAHEATKNHALAGGQMFTERFNL